MIMRVTEMRLQAKGQEGTGWPQRSEDEDTGATVKQTWRIAKGGMGLRF